MAEAAHQHTLFSAFEIEIGMEAKRLGIEKATNHRQAVLWVAREYVRDAAKKRKDRTATADDAAAGFEAAGLPTNLLGNAAGALFREACWVFTGRWEPSKRITNHGHQNRVWRLKRGK